MARKLKCWKKVGNNRWAKNKGKRNAEAVMFMGGKSWLRKGWNMKFLGKGKIKADSYMRKNDKC